MEEGAVLFYMLQGTGQSDEVKFWEADFNDK